MASARSVPYKQDLPPKGGYAPINYKRIPAKSVLNAPLIYGGLFASMAYGAYQYKRGMRQVFKEVGVHPPAVDVVDHKDPIFAVMSGGGDEVGQPGYHASHVGREGPGVLEAAEEEQGRRGETDEGRGGLGGRNILRTQSLQGDDCSQLHLSVF